MNALQVIGDSARVKNGTSPQIQDRDEAIAGVLGPRILSRIASPV
jgi:hypothetical protein